MVFASVTQAEELPENFGAKHGLWTSRLHMIPSRLTPASSLCVCVPPVSSLFIGRHDPHLSRSHDPRHQLLLIAQAGAFSPCSPRRSSDCAKRWPQFSTPDLPAGVKAAKAGVTGCFRFSRWCQARSELMFSRIQQVVPG